MPGSLIFKGLRTKRSPFSIAALVPFPFRFVSRTGRHCINPQARYVLNGAKVSALKYSRANRFGYSLESRALII
jgi:hypothetical protein